MCFDDDSAPPIPPLSGAAVSHADLVARGGATATGSRRSSRCRRRRDRRRRDPPRRPRPLPLLRGARAAVRRARLRGDRVRLLRAHRRESRSATNDWDYMPARPAAHARAGAGRHGRGVAHLPRGRALTPVFTVGFCFGGSGSWAGRRGGPRARRRGRLLRHAGERRMIDLVPELDAPILALQAGADQGITAEDNVAFEEALHRRRQGLRARRRSTARRTASSTASKRTSRPRQTRRGSARSISSPRTPRHVRPAIDDVE